MKKDLIERSLDRYKNYRLNKKKERELLNKKWDSLSLSDKLAYHQLIERKTSYLTPHFAIPLSIMFWFGLWSILLSIMLGTDLELFKLLFKLLLPLAIRLTIILAIVFVILDSINRLTLGRYSKRLLGVDNGSK